MIKDTVYKIFIALLLSIALGSSVYGQNGADIVRTQKMGNRSVDDYNLKVNGTLYLPNNTGSTPTLNGGKDSTAAVWVKRSNGKLYIYLKGYGWKQYATLAEVDSMIDAGGGGTISGGNNGVSASGANIQLGTNSAGTGAADFTADRYIYLSNRSLYFNSSTSGWTARLRNTGQFIWDIDNLGETVVSGTKGIYMRNNTAADATTQQQSPPIRWEGQGWDNDGAASNSMAVVSYVLPKPNRNYTWGNWEFKFENNDTTFRFSSTGNVYIPDTTDASRLRIRNMARGIGQTKVMYWDSVRKVAVWNYATAGGTLSAGNGWLTNGTNGYADTTKLASLHGNTWGDGMHYGTNNDRDAEWRTNNKLRMVLDTAYGTLQLGGEFRMTGNPVNRLRLFSPGGSIWQFGSSTDNTYNGDGSYLRGHYDPGVSSGDWGIVKNTNYVPSITISYNSLTQTDIFLHGKTKIDKNPLSTIIDGLIEYDSSLYATNVSLNRFAMGGNIKDFVSTVTNTGTIETDLYTYTTKANTLASNGEYLVFEVAGSFNDAGSNNNTLRFYFGGAAIAATPSMTITGSGAWVATVRIKRTGPTSVETSTVINTETASNVTIVKTTGVAGLTLTGTNVLKVTGECSGGSAGTGDISAIFGEITWHGAANN